MSYLVKKIVILRDYKSYYLRHEFNMEDESDLPYIAGDFQYFVPEKKIEEGTLKKIDTPLFNSANLCRIIEEPDQKTILFLELEQKHRLNAIVVDSEKIVVDIYYGENSRLLYSFFNISAQTPLSLTLQKENDEGLTFLKIKTNEADPLYRQYFIKRALQSFNSEEFKNIITPELMTAKEVADYLRMAIKTIQNWTSMGTIPVEYARGTPRYRKTTIDKWLKGSKI